MKKENFANVTNAIDVVETRKAAAEKNISENAKALDQASAAANAALEAEDMRAYQDATARKAMCEFKEKKLQAACDRVAISNDEYRMLNESLVKEYTELHRTAYGRLLSLAQSMKEIVTDLDAQRVKAIDLSTRLNTIHRPEDAFMLSFNIPYLTAARIVDNLLADLERGAAKE